ncbi:hypothetical protein ABZW96_36050 [Nocardia sp. NPDC004168]|uniref:hypothetical protein n=1 Tax=Nocardia sp. NPDC004168 TaxID=3154452 RepID=UPI0033A96ED5
MALQRDKTLSSSLAKQWKWCKLSTFSEIVSGTVSFAAPIVGNLILPGAGGLIGGAVGNLAAKAIDGEIHSETDVMLALALGGATSAIGGAVGGKILGGLSKRATAAVGGDAAIAQPARLMFMRNVNVALGRGDLARNWCYLGQTTVRAPLTLIAEKLGPPFNDRIPIISIGNGAESTYTPPSGVSEMKNMFMPDINAVPTKYKFGAGTDNYHKQLPKTMRDYFNLFGTGKKTDPPKSAPVPQITQDKDSNFKNYTLASDRLKNSFAALHAMSTNLLNVTNKMEDISTGGQDAINGVVEYINSQAEVAPSSGQSEDDHILSYIADALDRGRDTIEDISKRVRNISEEVDSHTGDLQKFNAQLAQLQAKNEELEKRLREPTAVPAITSQTPGVEPATSRWDAQTPRWNEATPAGDIEIPRWNAENTGRDAGVSDTPGTRVEHPGLDDSSAPRSVTNTVPPAMQSVSPPMLSGLSDMMGPLQMMMMQEQMRRDLADRDLNSRRGLDPHRFDRELDNFPPSPVTSVPAQQSATSTPGSTPTTTASAATNNSSSSQNVNALAARTPDSDGSVLYTFPDGRTQKVSAVVADVLDAAIFNKKDTDAQAAYEKTPARWSNHKTAGDRVSPSELMTGDVAMWDHRTAVLVVFGPTDGESLEVIVAGELRPFSATLSDRAGEFGAFTGFQHPAGIEPVRPENKKDVPLNPLTSTDQPASTVALGTA